MRSTDQPRNERLLSHDGLSALPTAHLRSFQTDWQKYDQTIEAVSQSETVPFGAIPRAAPSSFLQLHESFNDKSTMPFADDQDDDDLISNAVQQAPRDYAWQKCHAVQLRKG